MPVSVIINPATKYVVFRMQRKPLNKAWLAGNGHPLGKSHNAVQRLSLHP